MTKTSTATAFVTQVLGAVVDVTFPGGDLPERPIIEDRLPKVAPESLATMPFLSDAESENEFRLFY